MIQTERRKIVGNYTYPDGCKEFICAECGLSVELLTHTHVRQHPDGMSKTQEEYCRANPEHSYLHMWSDLPRHKGRQKFEDWRKGK